MGTVPGGTSISAEAKRRKARLEMGYPTAKGEIPYQDTTELPAMAPTRESKPKKSDIMKDTREDDKTLDETPNTKRGKRGLYGDYL